MTEGPKLFGPGQRYFRVRFGGQAPRWFPEEQLERFVGDAGDVDALLGSQTFGNQESLDRILTYIRLRRPLSNSVYAYRSTRTLFYEYQYIPLLKFLDSPHQRLLIADEVGLGKTIEAGLILTEIKARHPVDRVLIVCPSRLCRKWQQELARKFDEDFEILGTQSFRQFLERCADERGYRPLRGIVSLHALRMRRILEEFTTVSPPLDLVVVDEAHHMRNSSAKANVLGRQLSAVADAVLLLTATPIHLGNQDLFQLLHVLEPTEYERFETFETRLVANRHLLAAIHQLGVSGANAIEQVRRELDKLEMSVERDRLRADPTYRGLRRRLDVGDGDLAVADRIELQRSLTSLHLLSSVLTRTMKRDTSEKRARREAVVWPVQFSAAERQFYDSVTNAIRARHSGTGAGGTFALITRQRQMASSITAMVTACRSSDPDLLDEASESSDIEPEDIEDWASDEDQTDAGSGDSEVAGWQIDPAADGKLRRLLELLHHLDEKHPNEKVIVFAYFKGSIRYLEEQLSKHGVRCTSISGDVPSDPTRPELDERWRRLKAFEEDPTIRILLSTEVGGEGLDFQFCGILVNYDLPWNPMVVEQRIGRIDRFGQTREKILVYNLTVKGTIEDRILRRLYTRIRIFEESIGDLEVILGEQMRELQKKLFTLDLTPEQQEEEIERAARVVERRRQEQKRLEADTVRLFGHDEYVREELRRVKSCGRYVGGKAVRRLVEHYLGSEIPDAGLELGDHPDVPVLRVSEELERRLQRRSRAGDRSVARFIARIDRRRVAITFDAAKAYERPDVEFVTGAHPLIRTIIEELAESPGKLHPVSSVSVSTSVVPCGIYVFKGYLVTTSGARESLRFEVVVMMFDGTRSLDALMGEQLLGEAAESGKSWQIEGLDPPQLEQMSAKLDEELVQRCAVLEKDLRTENETIVQNRLATLTRTFEVKAASLRRQMERGRAEKQDERIQRMRAGALRNLEVEHLRRRGEIERSRELVVSHELVCGGVVQVV